MAPEPSPWKPLRLPALLLAVVLAVGIGGFVFLEGWSVVDSIYMTLMVLTTVGMREVRPLDTSGKVLAISLMVMGVTLVLLTLSLAGRSIAEGGLGERGRRRRMQRQIDDMRDHYIICAYGRVGRTVARELESEGARFVVIDKDEDLQDQMLRDGVLYLNGDPTSEPILKAAGIDRAKGLICAVDDDADNVYIALAARSVNPQLFIVARAAAETSADRLYRAGADRVISPYVSSGRHMALLALRPQVVDYLDVGESGTTNLRLEELSVGPGSNLVGRALTDASGTSLPLALRRADGEVVTNPDPALRLQEGDLLVLLGER
ncbi:MAG: potassium channel family protein [Actinomycetota bacterium]